MPDGYLFFHQLAHDLTPANPVRQSSAVDNSGREIVVRFDEAGRVHDAFPADNEADRR